MREEENILYCKLALIKLIDQCGYRCLVEDKPAFHNLCESAFEWAWNALGFKENYIYAEDFYKVYDELWIKLNEAENLEPPPISMLEFFNERTQPWCDLWFENEDNISEEEVAIKSGYIPYEDGGY